MDLTTRTKTTFNTMRSLPVLSSSLGGHYSAFPIVLNTTNQSMREKTHIVFNWCTS